MVFLLVLRPLVVEEVGVEMIGTGGTDVADEVLVVPVSAVAGVNSGRDRDADDGGTGVGLIRLRIVVTLARSLRGVATYT